MLVINTFIPQNNLLGVVIIIMTHKLSNSLPPSPSLITHSLTFTHIHSHALTHSPHTHSPLTHSPHSLAHYSLYMNFNYLYYISLGVSGPAVLRLSSFGAKLIQALNYNFNIYINFAPDLNIDEINELFVLAKLNFPKK